MSRKVMAFVLRPLIGEQNTARLVYRKQWGYPSASVYGNGGRRVNGQIMATCPMGITPYRTAKVIDPTVTGVVPGTFEIEPLSTISGPPSQL